MVGTALRIDPKTALFRKDFAANAADLTGAGLSWFDARRGAAMEAFTLTGMPTRRVEAWKYTDIAAALQSDLEPVTPFRAEDALPLDDAFAAPGATQIVLVNGYLHFIGGTNLSDAVDVVDLAILSARTPDWVSRHLGMLASGSDQALGAASLALMRGGVAVRVRAGMTERASIHLQCLNPARGRALMSHARILFVIEDGAALDLIETHSGTGEEQLLANLGMEIVLGANANLTHLRLQEEARSTVHVATIGATMAKDAQYRALLVNLGGRLSRVDMNICLAASGANVALHGVTVLGEEALADVTTVIDHAAPHTVSRQLFKSVLGSHSRAVMQGKVGVREGAIKSDSHQLFKALLLGQRAEADAKPELEIFADDVVCGHGAAIGALDEDALFYLESRGLPKREAKVLLVRAFLEDAMEGFVDEELQVSLWSRFDRVLDEIGGGGQ